METTPRQLKPAPAGTESSARLVAVISKAQARTLRTTKARTYTVNIRETAAMMVPTARDNMATVDCMCRESMGTRPAVRELMLEAVEVDTLEAAVQVVNIPGVELAAGSILEAALLEVNTPEVVSPEVAMLEVTDNTVKASNIPDPTRLAMYPEENTLRTDQVNISELLPDTIKAFQVLPPTPDCLDSMMQASIQPVLESMCPVLISIVEDSTVDPVNTAVPNFTPEVQSSPLQPHPSFPPSTAQPGYTVVPNTPEAHFLYLPQSLPSSLHKLDSTPSPTVSHTRDQALLQPLLPASLFFIIALHLSVQLAH